MKNLIALSVVLCSAILSCKNNQSQSAVVQPEKTQLETKAVSHDSVAFRVWKLIANDGKSYECPEGSTLQYYPGNLSEAEGYMTEESVHCFPRNDGNYLVILEHVEAAEGQGGEYSYTFYVYNGENLFETENTLPVPSLEELLKKPEEYPGQDDIVSRLDSLYNSRPRDFVRYIFYPEDGFLYVELHPLSYGMDVEPDSTGHCNWLEQFWEIRSDYSENKYVWNGEEFMYKEFIWQK